MSQFNQGSYVFPVFNSFRSSAQSTQVAQEFNPAQVAKATEAPPPGYRKHSSTLDVLGFLTVANSASDYITLALLVVRGETVTATLFTFALVLAFLLRAGAVYQYYEEVGFFHRFLNVFFGSRFGWHEKFDLQVITQAKVGVQFGFPLVMHAVADILQQGITFYTLLVLIASREATEEQFFGVFVLSITLTIICMFGSMLVRLSYGASLISLSVYVVLATLLLAFGLTNIFFEEDIEDDLYLKNLIYPWLRFISLVICAFTTTAVEVRSKKRIILPSILTTLLGLFFMVDFLSILLINLRSSVFLDDDQLPTDEGVLVDQVIYATAAYDFYVIMYMFLQWRLLIFGGIS